MTIAISRKFSKASTLRNVTGRPFAVAAPASSSFATVFA
jgi:hypothetical protein